MEWEEHKLTKIHRRIAEQICREIKNNGITEGSEIQQKGKKMFGNLFKGVFAQDTIPFNNSKSYYIMNVDFHTKRGSHWVAVYYDGKGTYYIYDSYGRYSRDLIPYYINGIKTRHKQYIDADHDAEQKNNEDICGQLSLAWLKMIDLYGIKKALTI
jgi:hypothetical protein